jgi:8-oxo-dGTP pyrophosphatase MutT (NUDIX family)
MVVRKDNKILLVTKIEYADSKNMFRLPPGGVKQGETDEATLSREMIEEFNQPLKLFEDLGVIEFLITASNGEAKFWTHVFVVEPTQEINIKNDTEHSDYRWVMVSDMPEYVKRLENVDPKLNTQYTEWSSWGKLRAVTLRYVYDKMFTN